MAANGCTAIRTHVDVTLADGLTSVEALVEVRERLRDLVDDPDRGAGGVAGHRRSAAPTQRALVREAIAMGVDVVGGCPHLEDDPRGERARC